jgi:hypothetical protein
VFIEQIVADYAQTRSIEPRRLHYQFQAMRGLATSAGKDTDNLMDGSYPEAVHVLFQCLEGRVFKRQLIRDTSFQVRLEAANSLAHWQNEHVPMTCNSAPMSNDWPGMLALLEMISQLFIHQETMLPVSQDMTFERLCLRNTLLTALSTIKSKSGHTPWEVTEMLLLFANAMQNDQVLDDEASAEPENKKISSTKRIVSETAHYKAVVLLALSRLRFDTINLSENNQDDFAHRIVHIAREVLDEEFTAARSRSRIALRAHDANLLPTLTANGIHIAAALTCLSEIDIMVTRFVASKFDDTDSQVLIYTRLIDELEVTPVSIYAKCRYIDYFLPPQTPLHTVMKPSEGKSSQHSNKRKRDISKDFNFFLCNATVRTAAYEAFSRLCFAMHACHVERAKRRKDQKEKHIQLTGGSEETKDRIDEQILAAAEGLDLVRMIAAAIEGFDAICKGDASIWVQQQCAQVLLDTLMDRPARIVQQAINLGHSLFSLGCHDQSALTLPHLPHFVNYEQHDAMNFQIQNHRNPYVFILHRHTAKYISLGLDIINHYITKHSAHNQVSICVAVETSSCTS